MIGAKTISYFRRLNNIDNVLLTFDRPFPTPSILMNTISVPHVTFIMFFPDILRLPVDIYKTASSRLRLKAKRSD